jgi:hypothetical protein
MSDVFLTFTQWTIDYPWGFWVVVGGCAIILVLALGAANGKW